MSDENLIKNKVRKGSGRSVSYPALTLEQAIARAQQLYDNENRHYAPIASAISCWGYGAKSSGGKLAVSALLNFGLIESKGSNESREVKITDRAFTIIHDPSQENRLIAIKEAAYSPKIYAELLTKWPPNELPSDKTISFYLLKEKGFNPNTVDAFISDFKETVRFANLSSSDNMSLQETETTKGGNMLGTGSAKLPLSSKAIMMQDTFSFDEGQVVLQWPSNMKAESFEDFKMWLELQIRKIKRSVKSEASENNPESS